MSQPRLALRVLLALAANLALVRGVWPLMTLSTIALIRNRDLSHEWVLLIDFLVAPAITFAAGGAVARTAACSLLRKGWMGLGSAWVMAGSFALSPPVRLQGLPSAVSATPPVQHMGTEPDTVISVHFPVWLIAATLFAFFAYLGDSFAYHFICRKGGRKTES